MILKLLKIFCILLVYLYVFVTVAENIGQLPHCVENSDNGLVLVSTLDGKLTALNTTGAVSWEIATDPGALLKSNIHNVELTNNGEWIRIIPSLAGSLYKFNGKTVDALPINADNLLKSSFFYSNDLVIAGGKEVKTYGVGLRTGHVLYTCSIEGCQNKTQYDAEIDDVIIVERNTHIVRAHEPRTGSERWNFSVGHHNVKIPSHSCANLIRSQIDFNITAILPVGLIRAVKIGDKNHIIWEHKFEAPIVNAWVWDGTDLKNIDTFRTGMLVENDIEINPTIYLAMHNKQLYIHESERMLKKLQHDVHNGGEVIESKSVTTIPWKPVLASSSVLAQAKDFDDSSALSVLYNSEYVNGNGFYLYTDFDAIKEEQLTCSDNATDGSSVEDGMLLFLSFHWHWTTHLTITIAICIAYFLCNFISFEIKASSLPTTNKTRTVSESGSDIDATNFRSYYEDNFDTIGCLGKGGFGIVFEAKKKIDQCGYAIKRVNVRSQDTDHVLREVRALANLDHKNIVRYFNSWFERPPLGYQYEHDTKQLDSSTTYNPTSYTPSVPVKSHRRHNSTIIDLSEICTTPECVSESSGGIVFQDESEAKHNTVSNSVSFRNDKVTFSKTVNTKNCSMTKSCTNVEISVNSGGEDDTESTPVYLYIQMQLCQQESLKEWLFAHDEERDRTVIVCIFKQILDAVGYVHSKGLIHRDLKPSNIFFSLDGAIKVGDFGLVTTMNEDYDNTVNVCQSSQNHTKGVGTRLYMSPEQIERKNYNYKVDIYSLGVILFELLVPFSTESERIKSLTNLRDRNYPKDFTLEHYTEFQLLEQMLSKNPEERPITADISASLFL